MRRTPAAAGRRVHARARRRRRRRHGGDGAAARRRRRAAAAAAAAAARLRGVHVAPRRRYDQPRAARPQGPRVGRPWLLAPFDVPPRLARRRRRPARAKDKPWAALTSGAAAAIGYDEAGKWCRHRRWHAAVAELAAAERAAAATLGYDERLGRELVDADDAPLTSELIDTAAEPPPPEPEPVDAAARRPTRWRARAGVALCGDALLIDANVRHGNPCWGRAPRRVRRVPRRAQRPAAKMQGRPCVGGAAAPDWRGRWRRRRQSRCHDAAAAAAGRAVHDSDAEGGARRGGTGVHQRRRRVLWGLECARGRARAQRVALRVGGRAG